MESKRVTWPQPSSPEPPRTFQISVTRAGAGHFVASLFDIKGAGSQNLDEALRSLTHELFSTRTKLSGLSANFLTSEAQSLLQRLNDFLPSVGQCYEGQLPGRRCL